jgi:hypothetical protein
MPRAEIINKIGPVHSLGKQPDCGETDAING